MLGFYDYRRRKNSIMLRQFVRLKIEFSFCQVCLFPGKSSESHCIESQSRAMAALDESVVTPRALLAEEGTSVQSHIHKYSKPPRVKEDRLLEIPDIF